MKRVFLTRSIATLALLAGALTTAHAQQAAPPAVIRAVVPRVGAGALESFHVRGSVWMLVSDAGNAAVSIGKDGVLVVNTLTAPLADKLVAEIHRLAPGKPIKYIINTQGSPDVIGGNAAISASEGAAINTAALGNAAVGDGVEIIAHENTYNRLVKAEPPLAAGALATSTFFTAQKQLFFNDEAVQILFQPSAYSDGDVIVFFRRSDVIVAGEIYINTGFPIFRMEQGGSYQGVIDGLNSILDLAIPDEKEEGGTYIIPGRGRVADEADVVEYRDMATIVRDRFRDAMKKGQTLVQVKAARLVRDYERRYGSVEAAWTTDAFIEAVYRSLTPPPPPPTPSTGRGRR